MKRRRCGSCRRGAIPFALLLPSVALALCCATTAARAQTDLVALRTVRLAGEGNSARTTAFIHAQARRTGSIFGLPLRASGAVWLDLEAPESSLVNVDQLSLSREWNAAVLRFGIGDVPWGISEMRSPIDVLTPRAVLWNSWDGPRLGQPLVGLTLFGGGGSLELVALPFARPVHLGEYSWTTWSGLPIRSAGGWDDRLAGGMRMSRTFGSTDLRISYIDGWDQTFGTRTTSMSDAVVDHPRIRQLGFELEWVFRATMSLRSEGVVSRSVGAWGGRLLAGVEWYPKPYLSLLLEQSLSTRRSTARSPLEDDLLVGAQLLAEDLRIQARLFVDPRSGNRHYSIASRRNVGDLTSIELELVGSAGDPLREPPLALRQPSGLLISVVRYF